MDDSKTLTLQIDVTGSRSKGAVMRFQNSPGRLPGHGVLAWLLFVVAIWTSLTTDAAAQGSVVTDQAALEALYDATGGDGWNNRTNWKTSAPLHEWYGVTTDPSGRVVNLGLAYNSLSGPIPLELGDLSSLVGLDLTGNSLNGSLPTALTNLTSVTELNLAFNSLSGPITPRTQKVTSSSIG